ncbi:MAG: hemerythrin domain-containing protein [Candidatus Lokiarchaeota archaeon]|jgi:hemerythrin-like domain-containing protein
MMPIGLLMIEHRLIERMIALMDEEITKMKQFNKANPLFIDTAVDFIRMYADRTHHGKEEDILFRDLEKKDLSPNHNKIMEELVEEHKWARSMVAKLVDEKNEYEKGSIDKLNEIISTMSELTEFYPKHIEKEDKHFFIPVMKYFTQEEQDKMLGEFWDFDKTLIHEKYKKVVENLQNKSK